MAITRPYVMSIAGFDPSGGAGLLADIKVFESHKVMGLGVNTALTFQNDRQFEEVEWVSLEKIKRQAQLQFDQFPVRFIKIGLIESIEVLSDLVIWLNRQAPKAKIIVDPILKASAGFDFHANVDPSLLTEILKRIFLLTPNREEILHLSSENTPEAAAKSLRQHCHVFLKGGHDEQNKGRDVLYTREGKVYPFRPKQVAKHSKHGSGCVLSSAIMANLAQEYRLQRACLRAKNYVTKFMMSSPTLLGHHKF